MRSDKALIAFGMGAVLYGADEAFAQTGIPNNPTPRTYRVDDTCGGCYSVDPDTEARLAEAAGRINQQAGAPMITQEGFADADLLVQFKTHHLGVPLEAGQCQYAAISAPDIMACHPDIMSSGTNTKIAGFAHDFWHTVGVQGHSDDPDDLMYEYFGEWSSGWFSPNEVGMYHFLWPSLFS